MSAVHASAVITVTEYWHLPDDQRNELRAFLDRHGIYARSTVTVEYDVIDSPLIRAHQVVLDEHGVSMAGDDGDVMRTVREVALREPLPAWWQPSMESTR